MNKFIQIICLLLFTILLSIPSIHTKGDIDLNGKVELYDLVLLKRYILGYDDNLSPYQLFLADANDDGKISNIDALAIINKLLDKE